MFDPNADPESIAARAAELSLEQMDRLRISQESPDFDAKAFYSNAFEVGISNKIAGLMSAYAVLKGYVTLDRANGKGA